MVVQPHAAAGNLGGLLYRPALLGHQLLAGAGFRVLAVGLRPGRVRRGEQAYLLPRFAPQTSQAFDAVSFPVESSEQSYACGDSTAHETEWHGSHASGGPS